MILFLMIFVLLFLFILPVFHVKAIENNPLQSISYSSNTIIPFHEDSYIQQRFHNIQLLIKKSKQSQLIRKRLGGHVVSSTANINNNQESHITPLDLRDFKNIVHIDLDRNCILVEGCCTMEKLLEISLKNGLIPKVVTEMKDMTIGGAIVGAALESSSFKYGQFNDICSKVWILTCDGRILETSQTNQYSDLWKALPGSYGTLGTVVLIEIECEKIKISNPIVKLSVKDFNNINEALEFMDQISNDDLELDFLEAIHYPKGNSSKTAVLLGHIVEYTHDNKSNYYDPDIIHEQWFYEKIHNMIKVNTKDKYLYLPLQSYFFRYNRGAFWMARPLQFSLQAIIKSPSILPLFIITHNNIVCRLFFRWLFTTQVLFHFLRQAHPLIVFQRMIIMDIYTTKDKIKSCLDLIQQKTTLTTPIWICPVKVPSSKQPLSPSCIRDTTDTLVYDIGIYGRVRDNKANLNNRDLDEWILHNNAKKMVSFCLYVFIRIKIMKLI